MSAAPEDLVLEEPNDEAVEAAVRSFAASARSLYGVRVKGIYLFGSRARGDHTQDSDADVAVVLADRGWRGWEDRRDLVDLTYDLLLETGADVEPWPLRESEWLDPALHRNPALVRNMRRDAIAIAT